MADFKKLRVYRHAHALSLRVDKSARKIKNADYAYLRRQMIKTGQSMAANIVEGREKKTSGTGQRLAGSGPRNLLILY